MKTSLPEPPLGTGNRVALAWALSSLPVIEAADLKEFGVAAPTCLVVLIALAKHTSLKGEPTITVGYDTLALETGLSRDRVIEAIKILEHTRLIECVARRRNRPNTFMFRAHLVSTEVARREPMPSESTKAPAWKASSYPRYGERWTV